MGLGVGRGKMVNGQQETLMITQKSKVCSKVPRINLSMRIRAKPQRSVTLKQLTIEGFQNQQGSASSAGDLSTREEPKASVSTASTALSSPRVASTLRQTADTVVLRGISAPGLGGITAAGEEELMS
jgi:hypothetical protein